MNPANMEKALTLMEELRSVRWAKTGFENSSVWIPTKIRKRFLALLQEHEKELLKEVEGL